MIETISTAAKELLECSAKAFEELADSALDKCFVEDRLDCPMEKWSGKNLDLTNSTIEKESNAFLKDFRNSEMSDLLKDTGWNHEIIDSIRSFEEGEIYKNANLQEGIVNDRLCLQNPEINWDQTTRIYTNADYEAMSKGELPFGFGQLDDIFSMTNKERALNGMAPLDSNGQAFELHHIGQRMDSALAELRSEQHRGPGNDAILHEKNAPSQIDRNAFQSERSDYWKARAEML